MEWIISAGLLLAGLLIGLAIRRWQQRKADASVDAETKARREWYAHCEAAEEGGLITMGPGRREV